MPAALRHRRLPCPTLTASLVSPASPNPASRSFPGQKLSIVSLFFCFFFFFVIFQLLKSRHNFAQAHFTANCLVLAKSPFLFFYFFFFYCLPAFFQPFWKQEGTCLGRQQRRGCQAPEPGCSASGAVRHNQLVRFLFFFLTHAPRCSHRMAS